MTEPFTKHTDEEFEHREITEEEQQLLAMALANLGEYIHTHGTPDYVLIGEQDPRNEDDYDSWQYGLEVLPRDHTWQSTSIDVSPSEPG